MPDRRRQRQQRVRHDAGGSQNPVGASNRDPEPEKPAEPAIKPSRPATSGVAYAEPKQYESVTIMPDKEVAEPQKYHRPGVLSNWSRYEELPTDEIEEGEDYLLGEDFSIVLEQQANSGGGFMQLKGESNWDEDESSILASHGLGVLHVADLIAAINTLPLYTQLNMPEETLPESIMEYYTHLADDNKKLYTPNSNKYNECLDVNQKILQSLKISDNEPLDLTTEEPDANPSTRNAVDIALSLSKDLNQVPEDVDLAAFIQEPVVDRQPSPVRQPSPQKTLEKPVKERPQKTLEKPVKERPQKTLEKPVKERTPVKETTPQPAPEKTVPKVIQSNEPPKNDQTKANTQSKDKTNFNFGLPKKSSDKLDFNIPKLKGSPKVDVKDILNVGDSEAQEEDEKGPTVDLDAPAAPEKSKPVLLVSKDEAEDLEDWLDSMLDD